MKIFLMGFMGSGKTHWGKIWAAESGMKFYDLDACIEQKELRSVSKIFEEKGEGYFRECESNMLRTFQEKDHCIIACGGGTPCYHDNLGWMNENGMTVYLRSTPEKILERLEAEKDKRPLIKNTGDAELRLFIGQKLKERETFYTGAKFILTVEELDHNSLSALIHKI